jgi:acetaldehyde dehydrogenase
VGRRRSRFVHAIGTVSRVTYAEIVATIASASAGPGTRQNIDHFTETTAAAIASVAGAEESKAIIVLNPADPPILMRDSIFARVAEPDGPVIEAAVQAMGERIRLRVGVPRRVVRRRR